MNTIFKNSRSMLWIIVLTMSIALLSGCSGGGKKSEDAKSNDAKGKSVVTVTTSFIDDMVKQLAGDAVAIELVIPAGEDPHLYVAQPQDLKKFESANLILYHGLHFEGKLESILEDKGVSLSANFPKESLGVMEEDGAEIIDPHFWFDIGLYKLAVQNCSDALQKLLPGEADAIVKNTNSYLAQLDALDTEIAAKIALIPEGGRYLVTPHDAFNYFSRSYGMEVVAPQGVSTDSEVSTADINSTVDFIVEHKVKAIFTESTTNPDRIEKLKEACSAKGWDVKVVSGEGNELFSDSLAPEGESGDTYISMYRHNVELIYENLK